MKKIAVAALAAGALLGATGCSVINTPSDMVALHYDGGIMTAENFIECVPASQYQNNAPGHVSYMYPTSLRYYVADTGPNAETGPMSVVSKDNTEMLIPVSVSITLVTDCDTLRVFHEKIAKRDKAFWGGSEFPDENNDGTPDGWLKILNLYVGETLDATLDRAAQKYNWRDLWNNPDVKVKLETEVENSLPEMIEKRMGGKYFVINDILVQKPDPANPDLKAAAAAEQVAVAKAKAAEAEAKAQENAAEARVKAAKAEAEVEITKAKTEAAVIQEQIRVMGEEAWIKKYGIDHGITPWPNPVVPGANSGK